MRFWPWSRYDKEAWEAPGAYVQALLGDSARLRDGRYLFLDRSKFLALVADCHYPLRQKYHAEFPDCDDFAFLCRADVLRGALDYGLKLPPAFGTVVYKKETGGAHAVNFAIFADRMRAYYEPQTQKWSEGLNGEALHWEL